MESYALYLNCSFQDVCNNIAARYLWGVAHGLNFLCFLLIFGVSCSAWL